MERILCILIGYVFGLFQTSYILGKMNHIDIRNYGSGNAGTTNALRTLGKRAGVITLACDLIKPMLACLATWFLFRNSYDGEMLKLLCGYAGAGAVLGHIFPFYLGFRGGKGIAAISGMAIAFGNWTIVLTGAMVFFVTVGITRYVSLGSILMMVMYIVEVVICNQLGVFHDFSPPYLYEWYGIVAVISIVAIIKHRSNIVRLLRHEENKFSLRSKKKNGKIL